jgi:hypothetical protein
LREFIGHSAQPETPVWVTEWGYAANQEDNSNAGERRQAILAMRECLTLWALGLPVGVWYDLRNDGTDPMDKEDNFGLLRSDNSDKPAMKALRVLTNSVRDHKFTGLMPDVPYGAHAMRLEGANDVVFVVWSERENRLSIQFPRDALISANTMFGEPIAITTEGIVLNQSAGPIYLRFKRP